MGYWTRHCINCGCLWADCGCGPYDVEDPDDDVFDWLAAEWLWHHGHTDALDRMVAARQEAE